MDLIAPRIFCVGTHHKTGTLWMRAVFRRLAEALGLEFRNTFPTSTSDEIPDRVRVVLTSWSSSFSAELLARADVRVLHLIRDPRDVLLSGMRYHLRAAPEGERFLHTPRSRLGGATYQQHLNALDGVEAKLLFEMRGKHAETVSEMVAWDYGRANTIECRYEDLMADTEGRAFARHLRDLGLPEPEVSLGARVFWEQSLFGGLAPEEQRSDRVRTHVEDGRVAQWRQALPASVARTYAEEFGEALVHLGYEDHPTRWLNEVRHAA